MKKIDPVVRRETVYIAVWVLIFSAVMEAVFLIGGWFNYTVPLGNLLGAFAAVLNFFLMGITVQAALQKDIEKRGNAADGASEDSSVEEASENAAQYNGHRAVKTLPKKNLPVHKEAAQLMKLSQILRNILLFGVCVAGALAPCFNIFAVLIPLLFPRIAVMLRPVFLKRQEASKGGENKN